MDSSMYLRCFYKTCMEWENHKIFKDSLSFLDMIKINDTFDLKQAKNICAWKNTIIKWTDNTYYQWEQLYNIYLMRAQ